MRGQRTCTARVCARGGAPPCAAAISAGISTSCFVSILKIEGCGRTNNEGRETINTKNHKQTTTFIGCLSGLPCWHLCLAPTGITRIRLFSVDCGSLRQSGPRPGPRLLRQAALEALTRSARTNTPRKTRPEQFPAKTAAAARGRRRRRRVREREAAVLVCRVRV
ncbi:hypothetical protein F511_34480 [Dorcoceras hygrometricum]|uniref:Uncharacterized protein n=1 Tax=Dorcoceras hygrometricum TaxID=472368 RepID=A0A2Z7B4R3_9LAMI|nr:hypothetical protein F511_34480 [Dorcoceras hygrometricum]